MGTAPDASTAPRVRIGIGGARADGSRRRLKRADQRGTAEPLIRGGPADSRALGLIDVPDANHEVATVTCGLVQSCLFGSVLRSADMCRVGNAPMQ